MSKWKITIEEMPKEDKMVVVKTIFDTVHCCYYSSIRKCFIEEGSFSPPFFLTGEVEYWCEIPKFDINK